MSDAKREHIGRTVRKELLIHATPREVWDAWAKAERIAKWFVDGAEGDMRAGDTVTWVFEHFGFRLPIEVYEAVEAKRLAFGGEAPGRPAALQEIEVFQEGGSTRLRLANSGFQDGAEWDEEYAGVDSGWGMALATLKAWLEGEDGPRTHLLAIQPAAHRYTELVPYYTTPAGLAAWLATEAELDGVEVGTPVRLQLQELGPLTGKVLAWTGTELLLSWEEQRGCLGLKAFKLGPEQRVVALDFNAWRADGPGAEERARLQAGFAAALARLAARL